MSEDPNRNINELTGTFRPILEEAWESDYLDSDALDDLAHALAWEAWAFFHPEHEPEDTGEELLFEEGDA